MSGPVDNDTPRGLSSMNLDDAAPSDAAVPPPVLPAFGYRRLRRKVVVATTLVAVVPLIIMTVLNYLQYEQTLRSEITQSITRLLTNNKRTLEFFLSVINAPLQPFLKSTEYLLTAEVHIDIFHHIWNVIRYIMSFFYIFLIVWAGVIFVTSSNNPIRRSQAKDMLRDFIIMMVLMQASFFLYELVIQINSILSTAIYNMIDPHFFMLTADNIVNMGLEFIFTMSYVLVLFLTVVLLAMRYIVVSMGVIMLPLALFCYFIPPLKGYGKFMLNVLGIFIFITFFDLLIILACSMIVEADLFEYFKTLIMINCFSIINYTLYLAIKFALSKSSVSTVKDDISQAAKYVAMLA